MTISAEKSIPVLDLHRQYAEIKDEVLAAIERVCASQQLILGPEGSALEREISLFTGAADAVACASGTDALWLSLLAAGIHPGDAVITTPFSFFASASSIVRAGATPIFADVDPATLNVDPKEIRRCCGRRRHEPPAPKAILAVHLYGQCAAVDEIEQIAGEHQLAVIEDSAQAIGARWRDRNAGSMGLCAAFSFYPSKNLSAFGDAGIATTQDPERAAHMRRLRSHGSPERYLHTEFGWNARMDEIQAAVLRVKLKYVAGWNQQRRERAATYSRLLAEAGLSAPAGAPIQALSTAKEALHVFHQYVVRAARRDELRTFLSARGISTEVYYPIPLHLQPVFKYLGYKEGDLPESERAAREVLALPMFPQLTIEEQQRIVAAIAEFFS